MSQKTIDNLSLDLEELRSLAEKAQRTHVQQILSIDIRKIETDIQFQKDLLKQQETPSSEASIPPPSQPGDCKRYRVELKEYAWDQSDKFIKIFVTINDVQKVPEENVNVEFTHNSFNLLIGNLNNKDYTFLVRNLLEEIDTAKSYRKIKSDMVAIYLAKVKPTKWAHLTVTAKRLQEMKKDKMSASKDDPDGGLMSMMQKIYESGDADTKRMINKAWHESQNKKGELAGATNFR